MQRQGFAVEILEGGKDPSWLIWAVASTQGRRPEMEDAHTVVLDLESLDGKSKPKSTTALFGVFDGHGGKEVAAFCAQHLVRADLASEPDEVLHTHAFASGDLCTALHDAFLALDEKIRDPARKAELLAMQKDMKLPKPGAADRMLQDLSPEGKSELPVPKAGSTAVVVLIQPGRLVVGHVGDSRCLVVCRVGNPILITNDHKPYNPSEQERIYSAGGFVTVKRPGGTPRVGGTLALSRALGDLKYKTNEALPPEEQVVTCCPETAELELVDDCHFMVLACDGVWDVLTPEEVTKAIQKRLAADEPLGDIVQKVVEYCLDHSHGSGPSQDNITLMLVLFGDRCKA